MTTLVQSSPGVKNVAHGSLTGAGAAATLNLGFIPSVVEVVDASDVITWKKFNSMPATLTAKITGVTGATLTADANSQIVINSDGTVTLGSTLAASGNDLYWSAFA